MLNYTGIPYYDPVINQIGTRERERERKRKREYLRPWETEYNLSDEAKAMPRIKLGF